TLVCYAALHVPMPQTGYVVQARADDPKPGDKAHSYQSMHCPACNGTHLVDPSKSSKASNSKTASRVAVPARGWIRRGPCLDKKSAHDEPRQNERHYIQARLGAVRQRRGAQGLGAGGPARDHKPPLNICQASQNP